MSNEPVPDDRRRARVPAAGDGLRLDRFMADCYPQYSRKQLGRVIRQGLVHVNGHKAKPGTVLAVGDELELPIWSQVLPRIEAARESKRREAVPKREVEILHQDPHLMIVNKPSGVPVHAGAGTMVPTLIDHLREHILAGYGLIHRLDKGTSGVIALVRGDDARATLGEAFAREGDEGIEKVYEAIVSGVPDPVEGEIDQPLTSPGHGGVARVDGEYGRAARTRYRTMEVYTRAARLELRLLTGRTHQIRAHLRHVGNPLLVDRLYGRRKALRIPDPRGGAAVHLKRTPLHAKRLVLPHPVSGEIITAEAPVPTDMKRVMELLRLTHARGRTRGGLPPQQAPAPREADGYLEDEGPAGDI